jgi:hypothetical protein
LPYLPVDTSKYKAPRRGILLEKLIVAQLGKKFTVFLEYED